MIFDVQSYWLIFQDIIFSLAAGFLSGFFSQIVSIFLYKNKTSVFIKDIICTVLFAVIVFSYAVSFSNYRILRLYNIIAALAGHVLFVPCFSAVGNIALSACTVFIRSAIQKTVYNYKVKIFEIKDNYNKKHQKITTKNEQNVLQNEIVLLYN